MGDGCLVICLDDEFESANCRLRPSDTVAPWHLRSPGGGAPCNYLFVRGEPLSTGQSFAKWNTVPQTKLLRRIAATPPPHGMDNHIVKRAFRVPSFHHGDERSMLIPVDGNDAMWLVVYIPDSYRAGDRIDVNMPVTAPVAPQVVSQDHVVLMAAEMAQKPTNDNAASLQGSLGIDPFRTHSIVPVIITPSCLCDSTGYSTTERTVNKKLKKQAELLKQQLLRIPRLEAVIVAIPAAGADWDEMDETAGCCCSMYSHGVRLQPHVDQEGTMAGFFAGNLHVYMRQRSSPAQLSSMSLSSIIDQNRDDAYDYKVTELARFGVVQSLPLPSRLASLVHVMNLDSPDLNGKITWDQETYRAIKTRQESTIHLIVLSLLGDCAIEMLSVLDRKGPGPFVIDTVDTCTWSALIDCTVERYDGPLLLLSGTPHAQRLVSGLHAMAKAPGLAPFMRPFHRRTKGLLFFAEHVKNIAKALQTAVDPTMAATYAQELTATKSSIYETSRQSGGLKDSLAFITPGFVSLGAGALPSARQKQVYKALRARRASAAVLWRFSTAGVAAHDSFGGQEHDGDHVIHVRAAASLPTVEVLSRSSFNTSCQEASLKQRQASQWKQDLQTFRDTVQIGVNADTHQVMSGAPQPCYTYVPGNGRQPPVAIAIPVAELQPDVSTMGGLVTSAISEVTSGMGGVHEARGHAVFGAGDVAAAAPLVKPPPPSPPRAPPGMIQTEMVAESPQQLTMIEKANYVREQLGIESGVLVKDVITHAIQELGLETSTANMTMVEKMDSCYHALVAVA